LKKENIEGDKPMVSAKKMMDVALLNYCCNCTLLEKTVVVLLLSYGSSKFNTCFQHKKTWFQEKKCWM